MPNPPCSTTRSPHRDGAHYRNVSSSSSTATMPRKTTLMKLMMNSIILMITCGGITTSTSVVAAQQPLYINTLGAFFNGNLETIVVDDVTTFNTATAPSPSNLQSLMETSSGPTPDNNGGTYFDSSTCTLYYTVDSSMYSMDVTNPDATRTLITTCPAPTGMKGLTVDNVNNNLIYFICGEAIYYVPIVGASSATPSLVYIAGPGTSPTTIAYDPTDGSLYFNQSNDIMMIQSQFLPNPNTTPVQSQFTNTNPNVFYYLDVSGGRAITDINMDSQTNYMYYAEGPNIKRIPRGLSACDPNVAGNNVGSIEVVFTGGLGGPTVGNLIVDSPNDVMYWTNLAVDFSAGFPPPKTALCSTINKASLDSTTGLPVPGSEEILYTAGFGGISSMVLGSTNCATIPTSQLQQTAQVAACPTPAPSITPTPVPSVEPSMEPSFSDCTYDVDSACKYEDKYDPTSPITHTAVCMEITSKSGNKVYYQNKCVKNEKLTNVRIGDVLLSGSSKSKKSKKKDKVLYDCGCCQTHDELLLDGVTMKMKIIAQQVMT